MKKAGFIAASVGTAALLAAGAAAVTHMITHPGDVVEEANASEIAPTVARGAGAQAPSAERDGGGWNLFSWFGGDAADAPQAASANGERQVLPGVTDARRAPAPATPAPAR
ncbi:MAG: hypothetical protein DCF16_16230, partial [Alphaproteobacteria bacterium]